MEQPPRKPVALVVISDLRQRQELSARLRRGGFEVFEAADADEAIRVLNSIVVDVLYSELDLHGRMDGIELLEWVRERQFDTNVVLLNGPDLH